ncbi:hypothetical protein MD484_g8432, partial [Candolleomyces efflorescens]
MAHAYGLEELMLPPSARILTLESPNVIEATLSSILHPLDLDPQATLTVGFDAEWNVSGTCGVSIIQLCFQYRPDEIFVVLVYRMNHLPSSLLRVFVSPKIYKVGSAIKADFSRLKKQFPQLAGQGASNLVDLKEFCIQQGVIDRKKAGSLDALLKATHKKFLSKDGALRVCDDWEIRPLRQDLLQYAALDAYASLLFNHRYRSPRHALMNPNNNHFEAPLNDAEQAQLQRRFPRAGWWFGMLPEHPEIHQLDHQLNPRIPAPNVLAPEAYPNHYPPPPYYPHPGVIPAPDQHYGQPPAFGHYRPRPPAPEPVATQRVVARPESPTQVTVIVPLNTGVVGGIITLIPLKLPADLPFRDFWDRVCAHMDLEPLEARLGYKTTGDPARMEPYRLMNEEDLRVAMGKVLEKVKRARTRDIVMEISNLLLAPDVVTYTRPPSSLLFDHTYTRKRARREEPNRQPEIHLHLNNLPVTTVSAGTPTQPLVQSRHVNSIKKEPSTIDLTDEAPIKLESDDDRVLGFVDDKENAID